jgi:hypothetical protein
MPDDELGTMLATGKRRFDGMATPTRESTAARRSLAHRKHRVAQSLVEDHVLLSQYVGLICWRRAAVLDAGTISTRTGNAGNVATHGTPGVIEIAPGSVHSCASPFCPVK